MFLFTSTLFLKKLQLLIKKSILVIKKEILYKNTTVDLIICIFSIKIYSKILLKILSFPTGSGILIP